MQLRSMNYIENLTRTAVPATMPLALPLAVAQQLVAAGGYREDTGWPVWGRHFRALLRDGSGIHLVIDAGRATIHWDRHDPSHRFVAHMIEDAPLQTLLTGLGIYALLRWLNS